jgi:hypothetical protein
MESNSPAEVSNQSPEDALAAAFEKAGYGDSPKEERAEPDESEAEEAEQSADAEESTDESDADEAQPDESGDAEGVEVEYEGKAYKLPKELKDALLRQSDYTRKTQETAAQRKAVEERAQTLELQGRFQAEHFQKAVEAQTIRSQLQQYSQVDWAGLAESNPSQYLQLDRQYRQLQDAEHKVNGELQHLGQQFAQRVDHEKQKARAACIEELRKDPEIGPKLNTELLREMDEAGKALGFSGEELSNVADPRVVRALYGVAQWRKLQGSKSIATKKVQTAKPVQVQAARSATTSQATSKLNNARVQAKKTGKASDVQSYLEMKFAQRYR